MAKTLTSTAQTQIDNKDLKPTFIFKIGGTDFSSYVLSKSLSVNIKFGSSNAVFTLNNNDGRFGDGGSDKVEVGDVVELTEQYGGDSMTFKSFYGLVEQRSITKSANGLTITLNCLDYIVNLKHWNIDYEVEGTRVAVVNEILVPVYLASPNEDMAQLFNFTNNGIATKPIPTIQIRDQNYNDNIDSQYDGFEIYYDVGQLKLGSPLNVRNNYDVMSSYSYYVKGKNAEDIIEEILKQPDNYGNYLFGVDSSESLVNNHLTSTFVTEEDSSTDTMSPNLSTLTIIIETTLTSAVTAGDSSIAVVTTSGLPTTGSGSINGDTFTWNGKTDTTLTGIPTTGSNALKAHASGDYFEYENDYPAGYVWYLTYSNLLTDLVSGDFTIPGGTFNYLDKRNGRIILTSSITTASVVTCNSDYSFKTLQASGIEINRMIFRKREVSNRLEAVKKVKEYLAPNYIIFTQGDNKIWSKYMTQRTVANYTLALEQNLNYLEDTDLFTRVVMWAKNKNPTNLMFGEDVDYTSDEEESYTGIATQTELNYYGEENSGVLSDTANESLSSAELINDSIISDLIITFNDKFIAKTYSSQDSSGYHIFSTPLSGIGRIILDSVVPIVYINSVPIDNNIYQMTSLPVKLKSTTKTITEGGGKSKSVSVTTYYYYSFMFAHSSIVPSEPIYLYDAQGILQYTISPNDPNMSYSEGIWNLPGIEQNAIAETISTASYSVLYGSDKLIIDYEEVVFKIHNSILPNPEQVSVKATFEYWAIAISTRDINQIVDGRRDTQMQMEFFGEPAAGFHLATIDLGASYKIQAIDLVGGFFKPDDLRRFDVGFKLSMSSSTDGSSFSAISDKTTGFDVSSGEAISFEEQDLGTGLTARYLKLNLESVDKIPYGKGRYVVAITELSVYNNIVIESDASLIATSTLTASARPGETVVYMTSTSGFTEPESGSTSTAYINGNAFTYTDLGSGNTLTGCSIDSGVTGDAGDRIAQSIAGDTTLYDDDGLLPKLGDRVKQIQKISDRNLYTQSELDTLAKSFLREYYKNHSKISTSVLYSPFLKVGHTVNVIDTYNDVNTNYFIDSISENNNMYSLVLARYP